MIIVGLQKLSTVDYPGHICAVVFLGGCNMNCGFCHNFDTAVECKKPNISSNELLEFLEKRRGLLEAVCISGGEPTLHGDELIDFIGKVKAMGYKVKLDTNGSRPEVVETLLQKGLLDYVAMDIKAPWDKYEEICRCPVNINNIKSTMGLINGSGVNYEYRTTYIPSLSINDIKQIASDIKGAHKYVLQQFRKDNVATTMAGAYGSPHGSEYLVNTANEIKGMFKTIDIRGI